MTEEQERAAFDVWRNSLTSEQEDALFSEKNHVWAGWKARAALSQPASTVPEAPTVEQATTALVAALCASKGWLRDYADSVVRDAVDRKMKP